MANPRRSCSSLLASRRRLSHVAPLDLLAMAFAGALASAHRSWWPCLHPGGALGLQGCGFFGLTWLTGGSYRKFSLASKRSYREFSPTILLAVIADFGSDDADEFSLTILPVEIDDVGLDDVDDFSGSWIL